MGVAQVQRLGGRPPQMVAGHRCAIDANGETLTRKEALAEAGLDHFAIPDHAIMRALTGISY
eukprot:3545770-Pyramimonas_sp.AAC.1